MQKHTDCYKENRKKCSCYILYLLPNYLLQSENCMINFEGLGELEMIKLVVGKLSIEKV